MIAVLDALEVICRRLTDQLLFNQDEAAGYLGIGETLFKDLVNAGKIKRVQLTENGHYFYTRDDLEEFVNELERQTGVIDTSPVAHQHCVAATDQDSLAPRPASVWCASRRVGQPRGASG